MASRTAILAVRIVSDATQAQTGMQQAAGASQDFERGLNRASVAAAGVLAGVGGLAVASFNAASELQQQAGAVEAVFGQHAAGVDRLARTAADRVGLSTAAYSQSAALIGSQLANMGLSQQEAAAQGDSLISMGADLAAQFGGSTSQAIEAMSSLLRGERDPIERYGVSINQAAIDAQKAAMGLSGLTGEADRNANMQATLALLTQQTATSQGAFAREADTAAGAQQRATAQWENAQAALGEALLPIVSQAAEKFAGLAGFVSDNTTAFLIIGGVLAGIAVAILTVKAAVEAYQAATMIAKAAQIAWNVAMSLNPLGLIIIAIGAVIAIVAICYSKFQGFRDFVGGIGSFFAGVWNGIVGWVQSLADKVGGLGGIFQTFKNVAMAVINAVTAPFRTLSNLVSGVGRVLGNIGSAIGGLFGAAAAPAGPGGQAALARTFGSTAGGVGRGASLTAGATPIGRSSGGLSLAGAGPQTVINVTGALDPLAVAEQIAGILRSRGSLTGQTVAVRL